MLATEVLRAELEHAGLLISTLGTPPSSVMTVVDDSRRVVPGAAFVAISGTARDGNAYVDDAVRAGASLIVAESPREMTAAQFVVRDGRRAAAILGRAAAGFPGRQLSIVGVTGTSGKSTTVAMLRHLLDAPPRLAASVGTLGALVGSVGEPLPGGSGLTTPGPIELQRLLRQLVDTGVAKVAMEVSSHALDQHRVDGVEFTSAIFTNLSRDHLDYHGTAEAYFQAKSRLIGHLRKDGVAVVNADDEVWSALPQAPRVVTYGVHAAATVRAHNVQCSTTGSGWEIVADGERAVMQLPLMGDFNVSNALAAAAATWSGGVSMVDIARRVATLPQIPGRLERIADAPTVLRDYAHKPDALERVLAALRPFTPGRLILVFGCGGDRDRGKRPIMGRIAETAADVVIVTSDNPRTEDPDQIIDEIEMGMPARQHLRIVDREAAIAKALALAEVNDVVLLAGKGHETYQIRGATSYPFDERAIVHKLLGRIVPGRSGGGGK